MERPRQLGQRLSSGDTLYGAWSLLSSAEALWNLAGSGVDYVVIDMQHGSATESALPGLTSAIVAGGSAPLVRLRESDPASVGRVLDLGAWGIFAPTIDSAGHAEEVVGACKYYPAGGRSAGRLLGGLDDPLCFVMIETSAGLTEARSIAAVNGVDGLYVGPWDLSISLGGAPDPHAEPLKGALETMFELSRQTAKPIGVHAIDGVVARHYRRAGCRLVTVMADLHAITSSVARELKLAMQTADRS